MRMLFPFFYWKFGWVLGGYYDTPQGGQGTWDKNLEALIIKVLNDVFDLFFKKKFRIFYMLYTFFL